MSFQDAADYTAKLIGQTYNNIYLGLSGGLDSEFAAEALYRNGVPFTPIIAALPQDQDHYYALYWCQCRSITPVVVTFTENDPRLVNEATKAVYKLKQKTNLTSVNLYLEKYVRALGGQFLTGDSPLLQHTEGFNQAAGPVFDLYWLVYTSNFVDPNSTAQHFLLYTPELLLAAAKEIDYRVSDSVGKTKLYNIPYRPKNYRPVMPIDEATEKNIIRHAVADRYSRLNNAEWHKDYLISLLTK
jgi:hypothetical protein